MHISILRSLLFGAWLIEPMAAKSMSGVAWQMINGEKLEFTAEPWSSYTIEFGVDARSSEGSTAEAVPARKIAVVPIRGPITKMDQACGPVGTETLISHIKDLNRNPQISAIILDIDSPGGQSSNIETFSNTIKGLDKPTIAHFNSMAASAAYWIASACDECYASEATDMVGSIGAVMSFMDIKPALEAQGVVFHEVYATQSKRKNKIFRDALEGDYTQLKSDVLDPVAQSFIDGVKANRPQITNKEVFTGEIYTADRGEELNLIDGIKSFDQVVDRAAELAEAQANANQSTNTHTMKKNLIAVAAFLGLPTLESKDGHISLSVENVEKIGDHLVASQAGEEDPEEEGSEQEEERTETANMEEVVAQAVAEATAPLNTQISTLTARLEELGGSTSTAEAPQAEGADEEDAEETPVKSWNNPNLKMNQFVDQARG